MTDAKNVKLDSLLRSAEAIVRKGSAVRSNGAVASLRTQEFSLNVVTESCRRLHKLGFYLEDVSGLKTKHIDALVGSWFEQGLSNKTIQNQFSRLKQFSGWLGNPSLVSTKGAIGHLPGVDPKTLRVTTVATDSKSLSGNGIDVGDLIRRASYEDGRFAAMMLLGVAFGLRKKEMLRIKPWKADRAKWLDIDGSVAKNGRFRAIVFEEGRCGEAQRKALDYAKSVCNKHDTLGWPNRTIKQNENRYFYFMKRIGLTRELAGATGHGLRAEYAENILLLNGLTPPTLGGTKAQMDKKSRDEIMIGVQNKIGHGNLHVAGAYYGSFRTGMNVGGIGTRVGPILVIDSEKDVFASLYCNPPVVRLADGSYKNRSEAELMSICITALVEQPDQEDRKISLKEFVEEFPGQSQRVERELRKVGLGKRDE